MTTFTYRFPSKLMSNILTERIENELTEKIDDLESEIVSYNDKNCILKITTNKPELYKHIAKSLKQYLTQEVTEDVMKKGFTLVEVMVVIVIFGILVSLLIPQLRVHNYNHKQFQYHKTLIYRR